MLEDRARSSVAPGSEASFVQFLGGNDASEAAVAAGLCIGALGTDTAASVRHPAAYCGVVGLKPTYGRVSTRGVIPLSWSLDHVGPLCRSAMDAALLLETIAGADPLEPSSVDRPTDRYASALQGRTASLRLGLVRRPYFEDLDADIEAAVNASIKELARIPPACARWAAVHECIATIASAGLRLPQALLQRDAAVQAATRQRLGRPRISPQTT
jgi:aspartyl-tRNA(Asn)/glutamyl-tRNA(Gln) amidotransferase subunit A